MLEPVNEAKSDLKEKCWVSRKRGNTLGYQPPERVRFFNKLCEAEGLRQDTQKDVIAF